MRQNKSDINAARIAGKSEAQMRELVQDLEIARNAVAYEWPQCVDAF
jgi:hypothetical protein